LNGSLLSKAERVSPVEAVLVAKLAQAGQGVVVVVVVEMVVVDRQSVVKLVAKKTRRAKEQLRKNTKQ
jgi:hypothetical protein